VDPEQRQGRVLALRLAVLEKALRQKHATEEHVMSKFAIGKHFL
jgi:hypothetical protein